MNFSTLTNPLSKQIFRALFNSGKMSFATKNPNPKKLLMTPTKKMDAPKLSPQMKEALKNQIVEANPNVKPTTLETLNPESKRVQDIYKMMDSSIEGFFYKRAYTLHNFNFLLQILAEKKEFENALKVFEKMKALSIKPNITTYIQLLTACSKSKDSKRAEEIFLEAKRNPEIGVSIQLYNSLMLCYTRRHEPDEALRILEEMKREGFNPDLPCYTTLINAYKNTRNVTKCWELYDKVMTEEFLQPDENFLGLMIEICAATHDAEKAKKLFNDLQETEFKETCLPYNALIKSLGSRKDYAQEAIETYHRMIGKRIVPDGDTFIAVLKACSTAGDVKSAFNALAHLKQHKLPMNKYIYNELLRTYAGAISTPYLKEDIKNLYLEDSWNLFKQMQTKDNIEVNTNILNSLLYVHTCAYDIAKVEGVVLPLYEQYNLKKDEFTYQHLIVQEMYLKKRDFEAVKRLYSLNKAENKPTFNTLNMLLESAMRLDETDTIVEVLQDFKKQKKEPKEYFLKKLCSAVNMPDRVYVELYDFGMKYGLLKENIRRVMPKDKYLTM